MAAAQASGQEVALEAGAPDDRVLISAVDTDLVATDALRVAPGVDPSSSHQLIFPRLGSSFVLLQPPGNLVLPDLAVPRVWYCSYTHLFLMSGIGR